MKKINSNAIGVKVITVIIGFCVVFPVFFYVLKKLVGFTLADLLIVISLVIGSCIAAFSSIVLIIEFRQDRKLDFYYKNHRNSKMKLEEGIYECQNCGNRRIKENDRFCDSCGVSFMENKDKAPYQN